MAVWALSNCSEPGLLSSCRLLIVGASLVALATLYFAGAIDVVHGLRSSTACGIFPDRGWNLCLLHWQVDSLPLRPQGSPGASFWKRDGARSRAPGARSRLHFTYRGAVRVPHLEHVWEVCVTAQRQVRETQQLA